MAYNGSGVWIAPAGQPVVTGTVIQASVFNTLISDIANTFNNTLPRDGQAPMAAPLKIVDGTVTIPGLAFNSESASGLFRPSTGNVAVTVSGIEVLRVNSGGRLLLGTTTDDGTTRLQVSGNASVSGTLGVTGALTANTLASSGATLTGGTINNMSVGGTTPAPGQFTTLRATGLLSANASVAITGQVTTSGTAEGVRISNDTGFYSGFNTANTTRSGYLQFSTTNTTLSNDLAGSLILQTNASARQTITNAGSFGFNMTPSTTYDFAVGGGMLRVGSGGGNNLVQAYSSGGTLGLWAGGSSQIYSNGTLSFLTGATTGTASPTGGTTAMTLDTSGNVLVGTATASWNSAGRGLVEINGSSTSLFGLKTAGTQSGYLYHDATNLHVGASVGAVAFDVGGSEKARIDTTGNVGIGVAPSAWESIAKVIEFPTASGGTAGSTAALWARADSLRLISNAYYNGSQYTYKGSTSAASYVVGGGSFTWQTAPAGAAGNAATMSSVMYLDNTGNLLVGTTSASFNAAGRGLIEINGSSTALLGFKIGGTTNGYLYHDGTNLTLNNLNASGALAFYTNNTSRISISSGGTTTFNGALSMNAAMITSNTGEALRVENDGGYVSFFNGANSTRTGYLQGNTGGSMNMTAENGAGVILNSTSSNLLFQTQSINRLQITNAGVIQDAVAELGWKDIPANSQSTAYTLALSDRGKQILITTGGVTVPQSIFNVGNIVTIVNNSATAQTITQGAGVTMHMAGTTNTGNRTLAAWGIASVLCIGSSVFLISGNIS